ncbi:eukaryotic-like serine/threonine-protein kinase [Phycisphaerales bacterium]|nr:eukaryotic-like serine/threonine-protein kinase [Phycisphaerales bacterium]
MAQDEPTTPGGAGEKPGKKPSTRNERDLIRDAINQATPRSGSVTFEGDLPADGTFPGYELLREVHRGGQGVVYQAIQKATRRKVALKVLHGGPFTGSTGRSRFEREVQVLGQLSHPNIVRLHDSGVTTDGSFFYVMDYISGKSLEEYIADKKVGIEDALRLFVKICDAVNAAHLKGVIHRDIKPSNVRIDANGEPIVVDFGLAKVAAPDVIEDDDAARTPHLMTLTGQFIGSLPWASPEQAEGLPGNIDVRTDVYSLGVVFYQMLTGTFPYKVVGNMRDVLDNILRAEPAKPSTVRRQINDEIETIVLKCLNKDRDRRYQTAGELARDLRHYIAGEPIEAKRDSAMYLMSKALRRYRGAFATGVTLVVLLIAFSIAMTVMYGNTKAAEQRAVNALEASRLASEAEKAQHDRADRNFRAGHHVAMAMINDIEKELRLLRGATKAREMLLKEAQSYLDGLRTEIGDDPELLLDLASAHEVLGNLRGDLYMGRTGEAALAAQNFEKAREIREGLVKRLPNDARMHAAMARSHYRAGGTLVKDHDYTKAREALGAAVTEYERALSLARTSPSPSYETTLWATRLGWTKRALGDAAFKLAKSLQGTQDAATIRTLLLDAERSFGEAEVVWKELQAADANIEEVNRGLVVLIDHKARVAMYAAELFRDSGRALRESGRRDEAVAQYQAALPKLDHARTQFIASSKAFDAMSLAQPQNVESRRSYFVALIGLADAAHEAATVFTALEELGIEGGAGRSRAARAEAVETFTQAAHIARRIGDVDAGNVQARRDLAVCLGSLGAELAELSRWTEAEAALKESQGTLEEIFKTDAVDRHRQNRAEGLVRLGEMYGKWAKADAEGRDGHVAQASAFLAEAKSELEALEQKGSPQTENLRQLGEAMQRVTEVRGR